MVPQRSDSDRPGEPAAGLAGLAVVGELLWRARLECGGDLDNFLLLVAVAQRNRPGAEADPGARGKGAYAQSMAAALAMPRETVRRKVAAMVARGWLARKGGRLHLAPQGEARLGPLLRLIDGP